MLEAVRHWLEKSPYGAALGVEAAELADDSARLVLPYRDENTNPGRVLHGGVAASLAVLGAQAVGRATLGPESGPWHTPGVQISYLAAAKGQTVVARARRLRKGKELCFVEVDVETDDGKPVAHASAAVRGRFGAEAIAAAGARGDDGASDPGPMGPHIGRIPFIAGRGVRVELMAGGRSRLVMPLREANGDGDGGVHEGAVLALLDTTGAMAAWAETGPGPYKASTPAMQGQILAAPPTGDLVGYGRVVQRDGELFWSEVEVARAADTRLVARGTVIYRIVTS